MRIQKKVGPEEVEQSSELISLNFFRKKKKIFRKKFKSTSLHTIITVEKTERLLKTFFFSHNNLPL